MRSSQTLSTLINSGVLTVGTRLHHPARGHPERAAVATVTAEGMKVNGEVYATPSAAAKSLTKKPVDGWLFWKLPNGASIGTIRSG